MKHPLESLLTAGGILLLALLSCLLLPAPSLGLVLAQKLNEQICNDLQQHFGAKAAFLQQLAQQLLVRKN